jgi:hypothetical protein
VRRCLAAFEAATTGSEGLKCLHGQSGDAVVLGRSVVLLVNGNSGMNNLWCDGLFVDDWLDSFMNVMVYMLALNSWCGGSGMSRLVIKCGILELGGLRLESSAGLKFVVVVELLVDDWLYLVMMLLREDFLMLDWLDGSVVMVLMDLTVNSLGELFMTYGFDVFLGDSWGDSLSHIGGVASFAGDAGDCCFRFLHLDEGQSGGYNL